MEEENIRREIETERYDSLVDSYNSILARLDPTPTLEEVKRYLLRKTIRDPNSPPHSPIYTRSKGSKPMFDEEGVEDFMMELRSRMGIDKVLSKLEEKKINEIVKEVSDDVCLTWLFFKSDNYHIDEADWERIVFMLKHNVEMFIRRAHKGTENLLLSRQFSIKEVATQSQFSPKQASVSSSGTSWPLFGRRFR